MKKEMSGFLWLGCLGGRCCWLQQQDVVDGEGWRRNYPGDSLEEILTLSGAARYPEEWLSGFQSWCDCETCQEPPLSRLVWVVTELLPQRQLMRSLSLLHKAEVDGMHSGEVGVGIYHSGGGLACKGHRGGNTDPALSDLPGGSGHRCWVLQSQGSGHQNFSPGVTAASQPAHSSFTHRMPETFSLPITPKCPSTGPNFS